MECHPTRNPKSNYISPDEQRGAREWGYIRFLLDTLSMTIMIKYFDKLGNATDFLRSDQFNSSSLLRSIQLTSGRGFLEMIGGYFQKTM